MSRRYKPVLVVVCALAGIFASAYVFSSPQAPSQQQHTENCSDASSGDQAQGEGVALPPHGERHASSEEYQAKKDAEESAALKAYQDTAHATWWLVIWTFCLFCAGILVGAGQIWLMWRQSRISASIASLERAWVILGPAKLGRVDDRWHVKLTLRNSGRTPAFDVVCFADWSGEMPTKIPEAEAVGTPPIVMGPGDTPSVWQRPAPASGVPLFYSGRITYRDQSNAARWTTFCLRFEPTHNADGEYVGPLNRAT